MRHPASSTSRRAPRCRLAGAVLFVAAAAIVAVPLDAYGFGATGNPAAIAFYRVAAARTDALPAYVLNQTGWMRASDSVKKNQVTWAWGFAQFKSRLPVYPAREHIVLVQHAGSTVWLEDVITPIDARCHAVKCRQYPIEIVVHRAEAYEGIVLPTGAKCFKREALRKVPYTVGTPFWVAVGDFAPKVVHGVLTEITSTYVNEGQHVSETDLITTRTKLFAVSEMHAAPAAGRRPFSYRITDGRLARVPRSPRITLCS
ncbi:MAG TPA: hypothetical protein VMQ40_02735 [Acidimicrobiales bacterium]|jgi:hypothetical protein|nr:hypothetical protein [Acidimicrobiales bacterium]